MARPVRHAPGGMVFHLLNRGVGKRTLFETREDYQAFEETIEEALQIRPMRFCSYCLMPNHWHFVVWPEYDDELSAFMQQLTNMHVKRWKRRHGEMGYGQLYQARFRSFPVQTEDHFYSVVRYVESNPVRANLVVRSELWRWSSLGRARRDDAPAAALLSRWPLPRPADWVKIVNQPQTEDELQALRRCVNRGSPFGDHHWVTTTARQLGLLSTLRPRGRPRREV